MTWRRAISDGDEEELKKMLQTYDVEPETLKRREVKYLSAPPFYEMEKNQGEYRLIPTSNIVGFSRADRGMSFYDILRGRGHNIAYDRALFYLEKFENLPREKMDEWFASEECRGVKVEHLQDTDEYIISGDGNHRGIVASCLNVPYIRVYVSEFAYNYERKKRYDFQNELYRRLKIQNILCPQFADRVDTIIVNLVVHSELRSVPIRIDDFKKESFYDSLVSLEKCIEHDLTRVRHLRFVLPFVRKDICEIFNWRRINFYFEPCLSENFYKRGNYREWNPYLFFQWDR